MTKRISSLDGLRGVAILLVLVFHLVRFTPTGPGGALALRLAGTGWAGVDLFFVLSGFLITGILYDAKGKDGYFRTFYWRRTLRIFPLYFLYLAVLFLVMPHLFPGHEDTFARVVERKGWYLTYTSNILLAWRGSLGGAPFSTGFLWSLAVEEQFYLLWPFAVLWLSRKRLLHLCGAGIVLAFLTRLALIAAFPTHHYAPYTLLPSRMDALLVGAGIALLARGPMGLGALGRPARLVAAGAVAVLIALALWTRGLDMVNPWVQLLGFSGLALLGGALLTLAVAEPGRAWSRTLQHPALRFFGDYSYGLYIWHLFALELVRQYGPPLAPLALAGGAAVLAVLIALVSRHGFENRFLAWRDRRPAQIAPGLAHRDSGQQPIEQIQEGA